MTHPVLTQRGRGRGRGRAKTRVSYKYACTFKYDMCIFT